MPARRECRSARIRPMPTAVLTRATHERALIGHREPDSDCSHGFFRTIDGEIAIEALMADPHAAPGPPVYDLPPAAPHRRLARMPMLMGAPVIVPSMNSIPHRYESGSAAAPSAVFPCPGTRHGGTGDALCQHPATGRNVCECNPSHPEGPLAARTMPIASSGSAVIWTQCSDRSSKCRS